jgi:hypothetical protein
VAIDILSPIVEISPTLVREYILNEIEAKSSVSNLNMSLKAATQGNFSLTVNKLPQHQLPSTPTLASFTTTTSLELSTTTTTTLTIQETKSSALSAPATPTLSITKEDTNSNGPTSVSESTLLNNNNTSSSSIYRLLTLSEVLNTDDVFEPILINYVIRQMINDPDQGLNSSDLELLF